MGGTKAQSMVAQSRWKIDSTNPLDAPTNNHRKEKNNANRTRSERNAEEAINIIDCWPHVLSKAGGKKPLTTSPKVLTEARRIFLTEGRTRHRR